MYYDRWAELNTSDQTGESRNNKIGLNIHDEDAGGGAGGHSDEEDGEGEDRHDGWPPIAESCCVARLLIDSGKGKTGQANLPTVNVAGII